MDSSTGRFSAFKVFDCAAVFQIDAFLISRGGFGGVGGPPPSAAGDLFEIIGVLTYFSIGIRQVTLSGGLARHFLSVRFFSVLGV